VLLWLFNIELLHEGQCLATNLEQEHVGQGDQVIFSSGLLEAQFVATGEHQVAKKLRFLGIAGEFF